MNGEVMIQRAVDAKWMGRIVTKKKALVFLHDTQGLEK
jgi:hypothetical protein